VGVTDPEHARRELLRRIREALAGRAKPAHRPATRPARRRRRRAPLWDTRTGEHLDRLVGHTPPVWSVAFSPDGVLLASAGDGTARPGPVWDLADRSAPTLRMTLLALADGWAALSPDGRYKLKGDAAGEFWHVIGLAPFEPGDIDAYLPEIRRLPPSAKF